MTKFEKEAPPEERLQVRCDSAARQKTHPAMIEDSPPIKRGRGRPRKATGMQAQIEPSAAGTSVDVECRCLVPELLTPEEAAALTKMSVDWFARMRCEKKGPPYHKRGRTIRYVKSELLAWWLEER